MRQFLSIRLQTILPLLCILFIVFEMLSYGFQKYPKISEIRNVSIYLKSIENLQEGIEGALKNGKNEIVLPNGVRVKLTINPLLQNEVNEIFNKYELPVGAFVAIEPFSGKILALTGYERGSGVSVKPVMNASFPAASLIKIVTASAAIEELHFSPSTKICYRSSIYRVSNLDILTPESERYPRMSITEAMAKSANNVFGKLTSKYLGRDRFLKYLKKFYFKTQIPFEFNVEESYVDIPESKLALARAGAGLGKVMISPLHASLIASSVANGGAMMKPYLIESIKDSRGNILYIANEKVLTSTIQPETASKLVKIMEKTPVWGTLKKTFSKRKWRYFVKKFSLAGKTGSITWGPPKLHYEWSMGIAPANSPSIAFVSMTGNKDLWHIKSTYVAREAIAEFFDYDYQKLKMRKFRKKRKRRI